MHYMMCNVHNESFWGPCPSQKSNPARHDPDWARCPTRLKRCSPVLENCPLRRCQQLSHLCFHNVQSWATGMIVSLSSLTFTNSGRMRRWRKRAYSSFSAYSICVNMSWGVRENHNSWMLCLEAKRSTFLNQVNMRPTISRCSRHSSTSCPPLNMGSARPGTYSTFRN